MIHVLVLNRTRSGITIDFAISRSGFLNFINKTKWFYVFHQTSPPQKCNQTLLNPLLFGELHVVHLDVHHLLHQFLIQAIVQL